MLSVGGRNHPRKNVNSSATLAWSQFRPSSLPLLWKEGRKEGRKEGHRTYYRINGVGLTDESVCFSCMFQEGWTYESLYYRGPTSFVDISFVGRPRTTLRKATFHVLFNRGENVLFARETLLKFSYSWMFALSI